MKTTNINTKQFSNAAAMASVYTPKDGENRDKVTLEYISDTQFKIKATDFIESIEVKIDCKDLQSFDAFSIDGKKLSTVLRAIKKEEMEIDSTEQFLVIKNGKNKAKIEKLAEAVFTTKETNVLNTVSIAGDFAKALKTVEHAVDANAHKACFTGALIKSENGTMNIVATDTRRLSINACGDSEDDFSLILPKNSIKTINRFFSIDENTLSICENEVFIENDYLRYSSKKINDEFIDYRRVVPQKHEHSITLETALLETMIKDASLLDGKVIVEIGDGKIKATALDDSMTAEEELECGNAKIMFAVEAKYILEYLAFCDKKVQLGFNEENLPITLISGPGCIEVVMPVNIKEAKKAAKAA